MKLLKTAKHPNGLSLAKTLTLLIEELDELTSELSEKGDSDNIKQVTIHNAATRVQLESALCRQNEASAILKGTLDIGDYDATNTVTESLDNEQGIKSDKEATVPQKEPTEKVAVPERKHRRSKLEH